MKWLHPVSYGVFFYLKPLGFGHHLQIKKPLENVRYQSRSAVWHAHIGDLLHASCKSKKKKDNEMGETFPWIVVGHARLLVR
jgi:hypothetical protein